MADALDSKSGFSDEVWVQVPSPVPIWYPVPGDFLLRVFLCPVTLQGPDEFDKTAECKD